MSGKVVNETNRKLAILLITTHGNLDTLKDKITYNLDEYPTVRKINATIPGVCNWKSSSSLNKMIGKINGYIANYQEDRRKLCQIKRIEYNENNILCLHGTDEEKQKQIHSFSEYLQWVMPRIDNIYKKAYKYIINPTSELKGFEDSLDDPALLGYIENLPNSYQLEKWEENDQYYDKIYTIVRSELVGTNVSAFDDTMFLLGQPQLPLSGLPVGPITRGFIKGDNITITLSEILKQLKNSGYTDTIIIDLSCNAAADARSARTLVRERHVGKGKKTKGNRKTSYKKKRGQKRRTKNKRTRKHRN